MGFFTGRATDRGYKPSLLYGLLKPEISGNTINGLGETTPRRPTPGYHRVDFYHPWSLVQWLFYLKTALLRREQTRLLRQSMSLARRAPAPVANAKEQDSPLSWVDRVKSLAMAMPHIEAVGIALMNPAWVFDRDEIQEPWVIILAGPMDYPELARNLHGDFDAAGRVTLNTYLQTHRAAVNLADWIRDRGWHAIAHGGPSGASLNILPAAVAAGIGQLGKHGSIMNRELGSCMRMSYVLTDLPLVADTPRDIGVDDFCANCQLCTKHCPPQAIFENKQMVRGELKWYVDFDKCVPFFNDHDGCSICMSICPWARPGVAPKLAEKMLRRRAIARQPDQAGGTGAPDAVGPQADNTPS